MNSYPECAPKSVVLEFCERDTPRITSLLIKHFPVKEGGEIQREWTGNKLCAKQAKSFFQRAYLLNQHYLVASFSILGLGIKSASLQWEELPQNEDPHGDFIRLKANLFCAPLDANRQPAYEITSMSAADL